VPPVWIGPHVGLRLVEAFKTLALLPVANGPRAFGNHWPHYKTEWEDLLAREQAEITDKQARAAQANRARLAPSCQDISRMEAALVWPGRYLHGRPIMMRVVGSVAMMRARGIEGEHIAKRLHKRAEKVRAMNRDGLDAIAAALRRDGVAVF
jgi:hypothetical protein